MSFSNHGRFRQQVRFLRRQFLQDGDLPFTDVLSTKTVSQALTAADVVWKDRIYSPLVTLWVFLSQVLSQDHSCRAAVARLIVHRLAHGQSECSADTGAYCRARKRLPEEPYRVMSSVDIAISVLENALHLNRHKSANVKLWPATSETSMQHNPPLGCFSLPFT